MREFRRYSNDDPMVIACRDAIRAAGGPKRLARKLNRTADDWDCLPKMDGMELSLFESSHMWLHQAEIELKVQQL